MTLKIKVNDLHFQYQSRVSQDACLVQIWWFQLKSVTNYRADKQKFTEGRTDVQTDGHTDIRRQLQCLLSLKGQGVKTIIIQNRHTIFRMIFLYANTHGWTKIMDMCSHARYYHITVDQMKSSTPSAAYTWYMRKWIRWALVQKTACRLFDAKPLYRQLNPWEQTSGNFNQSTKRFIHENTSENIAWDIMSSGEIS